MQVLFLPEGWSALLCFILWPLFQTGTALLCLKLPDKAMSPRFFWFRPHKWEQEGEIYDRLLSVSRWKGLLPDGATAWKKGYRKKNISDFSTENLQKFLVESCRGELTHWLAIPPFILFGLFLPPVAVCIMLAYALIVNLPCIIAQRYNRPRILRVIGKMSSKKG